MLVLRSTVSYVFLCAVLIVGCRSEPPNCAEGTVIPVPSEIPDGSNQATLFVEVTEPSFENGLTIITELSAQTGVIADPFARETTYACAFDAIGPIEICVTTSYEDPEDQTLTTTQKLRGANVLISDPLECSTTRCTDVVCPEVKNLCPEVSSLTVDPEILDEGELATVTVVAEDPDDNPMPMVTTLSAKYGVIGDPHADTTTYACDPNVGGVIEICVVASDGDASCEVERCTGVRCPGEPLENTCPIIESVAANPLVIPPSETTTTVRVDAADPDEFPVPMRIEWSAATGVFDDRFASETTFTCGASGPVEVCARANDGDPECSVESCVKVECPSEIPENVCPQLFVINGTPRVIPEGKISTLVQTRAQDLDGVPVPLTLTLSALWGSFENTNNILKPLNVVEQDATYICDRPGQVEVCVDATDGACTKTLCDSLVCPADIAPP